MRIASSQFQATMDRSLQVNQERITVLTQQMASGQRIMLPSDDPIGAVRLSRLTREETMIQQYKDNIAAVKSRMFSDEQFLSSITIDMTEARDLLVWASDGANTPGDLNSMVTAITALRDSIFYTTNTKDQEGRYIFSGTAATTAPVTYDPTQAAGARYSFTGNADSQLVIVGNDITQAANVSLMGIEALLNHMDAVADAASQPGVSANTEPTHSIVRDALDGIDTVMTLVSNKIAISGGSQKILGTLNDNLSNVSLSNNMALHDIGALDFGFAATDLNGYKTSLEATYKAYANVGHLSLFDLL
ncbi:MAG: flagellar hook-associated protein FlgL [Burkholderiaceae bacterium]|nr:flagellar hook-associated protein FlgL [Burkholderiaceae bacterium]